jgi:nucleoside-diphosphate-sugar epimerase
MNSECWEGKRMLVTGGAGFVGLYVVTKLRYESGLPADSVQPPRLWDVRGDLSGREPIRRG